MTRPTGWSVLAAKGLELAVLALASRVMQREPPETKFAAPPPPVAETPLPAAPQRSEPPQPLAFLREYADPNARYYRAFDDRVEALVALYSDGRIRIAGSADGLRLAGMLQNDRGEVLEIGSERWSRVYVYPAPDGGMQIELQGGAYDARVLQCEPLEAAATER